MILFLIKCSNMVVLFIKLHQYIYICIVRNDTSGIHLYYGHGRPAATLYGCLLFFRKAQSCSWKKRKDSYQCQTKKLQLIFTYKSWKLIISSILLNKHHLVLLCVCLFAATLNLYPYSMLCLSVKWFATSWLSRPACGAPKIMLRICQRYMK